MNLANTLNEICHCKALNWDSLHEYFYKKIDENFNPIKNHSSSLFSDYPFFISEKSLEKIQGFILIYESLLKNPLYLEKVGKSEYSTITVREKGILCCYDFHLLDDFPKLIEINTNAGGAMLNMALSQNIFQCCKESFTSLHQNRDFYSEKAFLSMFRDEYKTCFPERELKKLLIVDEKPKEQFLYSEFLLYKALLESDGIEVFIAEPEDLGWREKKLFFKDIQIDFVYNRSTDFYFEKENHSILRKAFLSQNVCISPNPYHHTIYAKKTNLALLRDSEFISSLNITKTAIDILEQVVPFTLIVRPENADELWSRRKNLFFKPISGYAGRGAYRGDKLTKKTFSEILEAEYIAQDYIPPSLRQIAEGDSLKYDVRVYTYEGNILGLAVRYYRGQTTNFRTVNGGFAPVYILS